MFRIGNRQSSPTHRHRKTLAIAVSAALLSFGALSVTAAPAQAATDLLVGSNCADQDQQFGEVNNPTYGWVPGWDKALLERQRRSIVCLINYARVKAGQQKLGSCSPDATYCDVGPVSRLTRQQMANLTTAAAWKAMEVDYMCTTTGTMVYAGRVVDDPHKACNRAPSYWVTNWWVANNPGVTWSAWAENLAPGYTSNQGLTTPRTIVNRWLQETPQPDGSMPHRANILDPRFRYIGVGVTPAWYGNIAAGYPWNWSGFRQVISADFID